MSPLSNNFYNFFFNSINSVEAIRQGALEIGAVPGISSIANSSSRSEGNLGTSSKASGNSYAIEISLSSNFEVSTTSTAQKYAVQSFPISL